MAAGWVLKGSIVRSEKIRQLYKKGPLDPVRVYCFLRATVDNWGMMPANKWTLKAELGPEDEHHKPEDFAQAVKKLAAVGLVQTWDVQGSPWLYVVGHDEANGRYLKRRQGAPRVDRPEILSLEDETNQRAISAQPARSLGTMEREREREREEGKGSDRFDLFWKAYPRKEAKGAAKKAWSKINPSKTLLEEILAAIEKQKRSDNWTKDRGKFIPHPATWLNAERWTDSVGVEQKIDYVKEWGPGGA